VAQTLARAADVVKTSRSVYGRRRCI